MTRRCKQHRFRDDFETRHNMFTFKPEAQLSWCAKHVVKPLANIENVRL